MTRLNVDDHDAWCDVCARDVNISTASVYDVKRHVKSKLHEKNAKFTIYKKDLSWISQNSHHGLTDRSDIIGPRLTPLYSQPIMYQFIMLRKNIMLFYTPTSDIY